MAEFEHVIKTLVRLCEMQGASCDGCPFDDGDYNELPCYLAKFDDVDALSDIEKVALRWEREHPKLIYPTWGQVMARFGDIPVSYSPHKAYDVCNSPISKEAARLLGIEPINKERLPRTLNNDYSN